MNFKELRRALRFHIGRVWIEATSFLPGFAGHPLYALAGRVAFHAVGRDRRLALANLRRAFPEASEASIREMARSVFIELLRNIFDVASAAHWTRKERDRRLKVEGLDLLKEALDAGRGVILMGAHQGAWELIPVALLDRGMTCTAVARPIREPRLDRWLNGHRKKLGINTLPGGGIFAAREARRILARGGVLGILLDQRVRRGGLIVPFFGRSARFSTGPIRLALESGAPILPVTIRRLGRSHLIRIGFAIQRPGADVPRRESVPGFTRRCVAELESMIRASPLEWAWIHPRWEEETGFEAPPAAVPQAKETATASREAAAPALGAVRAAVTMAVILGALSACSESKPPEAPPGGPSDVTSAMAGVRVRETVDGRLKWILTGDSAETNETTRETMITDLHVDFYNEKEEVYSVLTADTGVLRRSNNDMTGHGHVRVVTTDGDTLTTEQLDWDNRKGRVRTKEPFRLARPDGVIAGRGFDSDPGLRNYTTEDVRIDARGARSGSDEHP
jgi:KDO2-lipid IV(A) lauroyltransferase